MVKQKPPFPSKQEIAEFIRGFEGKLSRREIARNFNIKGNDRSQLRAILKQLEDEGVFYKNRKKYSKSDTPEALTAIIESVNDGGELIAVPTDPEYKKFQIIIDENKQSGRKFSLGIGEKVLSKLKPTEDPQVFHGTVIRVIAKEFSKVYGFARLSGRGFSLAPTSRKINKLLTIASSKLDIKEGDFLSGQVKASAGRHSTFVPEAILGHEDDKHIISSIAVHTQGLKEHFSQKSVEIAQKAHLPPLNNREDLRDIPLVTIDGEDARDFDDAVYARKDDLGWHLIVAIADVAYYVKQDSPLDKDAYVRGNSTYFPDRVLPMLPEELSNGLCSLRPNEDRACLAVHLWIDEKGELKKHKFVRALMRSHARLTYTTVQHALDGKKVDLSPDFVKETITPLHGAYKCLKKAREGRGTLDFDRDEPKIILNDQVEPTGIDVSERHDSHRLIEEFMITANVAAAKTLEESRSPCMYRVHEPPNPMKVEDLREALKGLGIKLAKAQTIQPMMFTQILNKVHGSPIEHLVNQLILRTQSRAIYSPKNGGHFGLSLPRYGHFTSPIRRYADLIVHRSLISSLKLGKDGLHDSLTLEKLEEIAEYISDAERTSDQAEWATTERFMALYLSKNINETFKGRIDGVSRYGLFVELEDLGATGIVPMRTLNDDFYHHDPIHHKLIGKRTGTEYTLGDTLEVILKEANPLTGSITLLIPSKPNVNRKKRPGKRKFN